MFKPRLIAYLEESKFKTKIQEIAELKKIDICFATQGDQLSQLAKTYVPFLMLIDLSGLDAGWLFRHISILKNMRPNFPICVVVPEEQESIKARAEKYGCDKIITQSELIKEFPNIIENAFRKTSL